MVTGQTPGDRSRPGPHIGHNACRFQPHPTDFTHEVRVVIDPEKRDIGALFPKGNRDHPRSEPSLPQPAPRRFMKRIALHGLAVVALAATTLAIWHWRFVAVPGALPETRLAKPLVGWQSLPYQQHQVINDQGEALLRLQRDNPQDKSPSVGIWLGALEGVRFIHIRCESRWENVVRGDHGWNIARFVVALKDAEGGIRHPQDSVIFHGTGTSGWRADEVILELTGEMADTGLFISMLGKTGLLEVRNLSVVAVKQRPWIPLAATALVLGWIAFCTSLLRRPSAKPAWWRATAAATMVVGVSWILVFPQTRNLHRSSLGGFAIGALPAPPPPAKAPPQPKPGIKPTPKPPAHPPPSVAVKPPTPPAPPAAKPTPEPVRRQSGTTHNFIRESSKRFRLLHIGTYAGFTFLILLITGQGRQWPLPLAVAILSELVPAILDHIGDWDDWTDLFQNTAGVALAVLAWQLWQRIRAKRTRPQSCPTRA